jgi:ABC-type dipeptide/oligopeptide/nickel transport system permease component
MARVVARRLLFSVFVLWGVTIITFFLARIAPGDPARLIAGPHANAQAVANVRVLYGLDQPVLVQYAHYLADLVRGDLGLSFVTRRPVAVDLAAFLPATLELALLSLLVGALLGFGLGIFSAARRGRRGDVPARLVAIAGLSLPAFWVAMVLQLVVYSRLGLLPFGGRLDTGMAAPPQVTGFLTIDSLLAGQLPTFVASLRHLILPVVTLALAEVGLMARVARTSMLDTMGDDYVRTARAKGLPESKVVGHHVLRNALLPAVTILGLEAALLAGGVFLVETIFAWPGIGRYAYDAIRASDYNAIMGVTLVIAIAYVLINMIVDVAYVYLDPRIRYA